MSLNPNSQIPTIHTENTKSFIADQQKQLKKQLECENITGKADSRMREQSEDLSFVSESDDEATNRKRRLIDKRVVDTLVAEVARKDAAISSKAGDGNTDMIIDLEYLALGG